MPCFKVHVNSTGGRSILPYTMEELTDPTAGLRRKAGGEGNWKDRGDGERREKGDDME